MILYLLSIVLVIVVVIGPRFGYDTHSRRMRGVCETVCGTLGETQAQAEVIYIISMRLARWFPR
jgi:hypothetical protein